MAVKASATSAAENWATKFSSSGTKAQQGAMAVTVAPGQAAARQAQVWAANVAAAVQKFARNVGAVSLNEWQTAYVNTGIPRFASGAQKGQPKMQQFMTAFLPTLTAAVNSLPPRGTYDQNKARAVALMDKLHQFSYNKATGA